MMNKSKMEPAHWPSRPLPMRTNELPKLAVLQDDWEVEGGLRAPVKDESIQASLPPPLGLHTPMPRHVPAPTHPSLTTINQGRPYTTSHMPSIPLREKCPERRQISHIHRSSSTQMLPAVGNSTASISEPIRWLRLLLALSSLLKMTATAYQKKVQGTRLATS